MMPYNIQIELVEGCNRRCAFCGIQSLYDSDGKMDIQRMDGALFYKCIDSLVRWGFDGKRIEFAMHGEPTLHPNLLSFIWYTRKHLPAAQLSLTSNCKILLPRKRGITIESLFDEGLDYLLADTYTNKGAAVAAQAKAAGIPYFSYYDPECPNPYHYHRSRTPAVIDMGNLAVESGKRITRTILNHAGNLPREACFQFGAHWITQPLRKKCSRTHREITIHWDGTVPICCMDWRHEMIMGLFPEDGSLQEIWESKVFSLARELHFRKVRGMRPCAYCDYNGGGRIGLLAPVPGYAKLPTKKLIQRFLDAYSHDDDCKSDRPLFMEADTLKLDVRV